MSGCFFFCELFAIDSSIELIACKLISLSINGANESIKEEVTAAKFHILIASKSVLNCKITLNLT